MKRTLTLIGGLLADIPHGKGRFAASSLLAALASSCSVALMGVSAWLLSRAAEHPPVLYLEAAAVGVRAFGIGRGVFRYLERLVGHDLALRMQGVLRIRSYDALSRTTLLGRRRGDLLSRVTADVEAVQDIVVRVAIPFCSASLVILGTSVMLARFSPGSALVLLASGLLAGVMLPWLTQRLSLHRDLAASPLRGELASQMREIARTAADVTAYGMGDVALHRLLESDARLREADRRAAWVRGLATAGQMLAAGVAVIGALLIGAPAVAAGRLPGRDLAVLVLTPLAMHEVLTTFTLAAQTMTRARASLLRVADVIDAPPVGSGDAAASPGTGVPGIDLIDVDAGWPGRAPVLHDVTLSVGPGERVALVGPSGVGKTTLAATIMGLIPPLAGDVRHGGRVGYLAQDAHIFTTSVEENVRIGAKDATRDQIVAALRHAGLPIDPGRLIGEDGATVSGGEARRLALARVLIGSETGDPNARHDVLILDEPTEHLDAETATSLMDDLWAATSDVPMLVITHDPAVMAACSRVVRLGEPAGF